jgi:hypothetical protein
MQHYLLLSVLSSDILILHTSLVCGKLTLHTSLACGRLTLHTSLARGTLTLHTSPLPLSGPLPYHTCALLLGSASMNSSGSFRDASWRDELRAKGQEEISLWMFRDWRALFRVDSSLPDSPLLHFHLPRTSRKLTSPSRWTNSEAILALHIVGVGIRCSSIWTWLTGTTFALPACRSSQPGAFLSSRTSRSLVRLADGLVRKRAAILALHILSVSEDCSMMGNRLTGYKCRWAGRLRCSCYAVRPLMGISTRADLANGLIRK